MLKRPKASNVNPRKPMPFWLLVGTSCLALAGVLGTISTRTVQADARLPRPAATATPVVASPTPVPAQTQPVVKKKNPLLRGIASWYGAMFDGRKTASGETFNQDELTACHPNLPFGSEVRVVNLRNKKSVIVRITDRGDLVKGRIIDLSYAAAQKLDMTKSGLARVSIEVLSLGHPGSAE